MTPETTVFLLTLGLGLVHLAIGAIARAFEVDLPTLLGSRDDLPPRKNLYGIRGERANHNFKETLPWALGLLILVQVTDNANAISAIGAWTYFGGRAVYLPIYVFGVPIVRSIAFVTSMVGLATIVSQIVSL
ncbi:MAG: MAPEG family protein [Cyanobacteriota bacterium]|nr:MAPEG family protein [Cyanobacteriota bacterium]